MDDAPHAVVGAEPRRGPRGHGAVSARLEAPDRSPSPRGRYGRMFDYLPARGLSPGALEQLFGVLEDHSGDFVHSKGNLSIPAGYTYLGQFVDHDLTFDPTSRLRRSNDPAALVNFRTPRLDLDSLYGSGPIDEPFRYEYKDARDRGLKLLVDHVAPTGGAPYDDLPRNGQGIALISDPRNDENLIVAQLHLLLIKFHNKVIDYVRDTQRLEGQELFREAQRIVRWHYQWVVIDDHLRRLVGTTMLESVLRPGACGPTVARRHFRCDGDVFMPVEFSGAAYRCGHSMVRLSYAPNQDDHAKAFSIFQNSPDEHFTGHRRLPERLVIDWRFFFDFPGDAALPQQSMKLDTHIATGLFALPDGVSVEGVVALPLLNLRRAIALGLPAGPDVATAMGKVPLTVAQLRIGPIKDETIKQELLRAAPLWYYVLCEAALPEPGPEGEHLGPVGGRIVAEVLLGLLEADPTSYLHQLPSWTPELPGTDGTFGMPDIIRFTDAQYAAP